LLLLCIWFIVINSLQMTEILGKVNMKSKPKKVQWFQIVFGAVLLSLRLDDKPKSCRKKGGKNKKEDIWGLKNIHDMFSSIVN